MGNTLLLRSLRKITKARHARKARNIARRALDAYLALDKWGG